MASVQSKARAADRVIVLTGDDPIGRERALAALRDRVVAPALRDFNLDMLDAKTAGVVGILNAAQTLPMMGPERLVVVRDAETLGAEGLAGLMEYLAAPNPSTVLVLLVDKIDGRQKFFAAAKKAGVIKTHDTPKQAAPFIQDEARRLGVRITTDAVRRLADAVGRDTGRLVHVVEQLALYAGDAPVGVEHVEDLVADTRERTAWELSEAVGARDRRRALGAVARLFEQRESAIGMNILLARHFRQVGIVAELDAARVSRSEIPRLAGVPPFSVDKLLAEARATTPAALRCVHHRLARADRELKSARKGAVGERVLVEEIVDDIFTLLGRQRCAS